MAGTWSSGGSLSTARNRLGGCGTQTAGLAFGGSPFDIKTTEEYNGTSWSAGGSLTEGKHGPATAGTQTAGLVFGGKGASFKYKITQEYNGTSWSSGGNMSVDRVYHGGAGSQSEALSFAGESNNVTVSSTEEYIIISAPTVTTQSATNIATTSCTGNGNITATGGANATRRGFCYKAGTSGDPTTSDSVAYDDGSFGTGAFTKTISGLSPNTDYRVRAYAVNSAGISYGATVNVKTLSAFIPRTTWF